MASRPRITTDQVSGGEVSAGEAAAFAAGTAAVSGAVGAGFGGLIGSMIPRWHVVYQRP